MGDAPPWRGAGRPAPGDGRPARVLTPDEEARLLQAHAELSGDLAEAARLQTAGDPLEETQENPELPALLRTRAALAPPVRRRPRRRLHRAGALLLFVTGVALVLAALLSRPG